MRRVLRPPFAETIDDSSHAHVLYVADSRHDSQTEFRSIQLRWTGPDLSFFTADD